MNQILTVSDIRFSLNGVEHLKKFFSDVVGDKVRIYNAYNPYDVLLDYSDYSDITLDGVVYGSSSALQSALLEVIYAFDSGAGGGSIDQDNKFLPIWFNYTESPPTTTEFANRVNALPSFVVSEKQIPLFSASSPKSEDISNPTTYKFVLTGLGKGTYGSGGIEVLPENIAIIYVAKPDEGDILNNASTQFFDIADLGGMDVDEYVNAHTPPYVIQDQELGYRVFRVMIGGDEVNYLFLADGGTYGLGELQTVPEDFSAFGTGEIPTPPVIVPTLQQVSEEGATTFIKLILTGGTEIYPINGDSDSFFKIEDDGSGVGSVEVKMIDGSGDFSEMSITSTDARISSSDSTSGNVSNLKTAPNKSEIELTQVSSNKLTQLGVNGTATTPRPYVRYTQATGATYEAIYNMLVNSSHETAGTHVIDIGMPNQSGRMLVSTDTNIVPDASLSVSGVVNITTQSFKGNKTIEGLDATTNPVLLLRNSSGTAIITFRNNQRAEVGDNFIFDFARVGSTEATAPLIRFTGTNVTTQTLFAEQGNVVVSAGLNARGSAGVTTPKLGFGSSVGSATSPVLQPGNGFKGGVYFIGNTGIGDIGFSTGDTGDAVALARMIIHRNGGVGVGSSLTPNASAQLDVNSTTKGLLPPRMTTTQKNAIASPASGLVVHDTTLDKLCVYEGSAWQILATELSLSTALSNAIFNAVSAAGGTTTLTVTGIVNYYTFTGTTATYTLPVPSGNAGKRIVVINQGSGTVDVNSNGGANVIFESSPTLVNTIPVISGQQYSFYCNGSTWSAVA